jgi:hypothetical protein
VTPFNDPVQPVPFSSDPVQPVHPFSSDPVQPFNPFNHPVTPFNNPATVAATPFNHPVQQRLVKNLGPTHGAQGMRGHSIFMGEKISKKVGEFVSGFSARYDYHLCGSQCLLIQAMLGDVAGQ